MISRALILASLALAPIAVASAPAAAQTEPNELKEVEQRLKDRTEEEKRLRREAEQREQEVAALRHRLIETANSIQESERKATSLEEKIAELETEKAAAETSLKAESENLSSVLAALQSLELSKPPALLVSPSDANEAARAAMLLSGVAPEVEARASRLRAAISRLTELTDNLNAEQAAYEQTTKQLAARRDVLADLMAQKEKERDVAASLAAAAQRETARLALRANTLREVLERLERLAHTVAPRIKPPKPQETQAIASLPTPPTIKETSRVPFNPPKSFDAARGLLRPPVAGRLTGGFGEPDQEGGRLEGMRFAARGNAIVTAPFEGKVVVAQPWKAYGSIVILDVGGGYYIVFLGVGDILVEENQRIAAGEPVAQMAAGGGVLDLEIRKNGEPVNPAFWLSSKNVEESAL